MIYIELRKAAENFAMPRSMWPSEREVLEALVKIPASLLHGGIPKIFYHVSAIGAINGSDIRECLFRICLHPEKNACRAKYVLESTEAHLTP